MTLLEIKKEKELFISVCEKYQKYQGRRSDLDNDNKKYSRPELILRHFKHIWPNTTSYIAHHLDAIYDHLLKEDENMFFSIKLFYHKWKPVTLINFVNSGYLEMDVENKFYDMLYNDLTSTVKKTKEVLIEYYCNKIGHLYVVDLVNECKDLPDINVKKIGYSASLYKRIKAHQTWLPYTLVPKIYIIVEGYSDVEIELLVHNKFAEKRIKLEMFSDVDNLLTNQILDYITSLPNIKIREVITEEELRKICKIKINEKELFIPDFMKVKLQPTNNINGEEIDNIQNLAA